MDLVFTLSAPVTDATGFAHNSLTLRELTVDEHITLESKHGHKTPLAQDREYYAMMASVPAEVIGGIKRREWAKLRAFYEQHLGNDAPTSGNSE